MKIETSFGELSHSLTLLGSLAPPKAAKGIAGYDPVSGLIGYPVDTQGNATNGQGGLAAVKSCGDLITTNLAIAEKYVVEMDDRGVMRPLPDHDVTVLFGNPSKMYNRFAWELMMYWNVLQHGNAYAHIRRSGRDKRTPVELIPAGATRVERRNGITRYWLSVPAKNYLGIGYETIEVPSSEVLHICALNPSYATGLSPSPMSYAFKTASLYMEAVDRMLDLVKQGGYPHYLKLPEGVPFTDVVTWFQEFKANFLDKGVLGNFAPLYGGAEMQTAGFSNVDTGILEMLRFEIAEVARVFGVPQSLIGHHEKGSSVRNANIVTADFTALKKRALLPYAESFIAEIDRKLVRPAAKREYARTGEMRNLSFRYDFKRVDEASEMEQVMVAKNMLQSGAATPNEVRTRYFGLEPLDGGDELPLTTGAGRQGPPPPKQDKAGKPAKEESTVQ